LGSKKWGRVVGEEDSAGERKPGQRSPKKGAGEEGDLTREIRGQSEKGPSRGDLCMRRKGQKEKPRDRYPRGTWQIGKKIQ